MTQSLQDYLNLFIYETLSNDTLIKNIRKQNLLPKLIKQNSIDLRSHGNFTEKQQEHFNAHKYATAFKIYKTTPHHLQFYRFSDLISPTLGLPLNITGFLTAIELLGSPEQVKYWQQEVLEGRVIGAYAQTELGHGSNVKNLETTAIFNQDRQNFTINTPSNTSAKYWPGILGHFGTHGVVQAKTIVKGQNIGVQTFVVEIRNEKLQLLKNRECFDIGPKLGFVQVDNGCLILKNVEVPLNALLMRYVTVDREGKVSGLQNKSAIKYGYGSMLSLRVVLCYVFAIYYLAVAGVNHYQILKSMGKHQEDKHRKVVAETLSISFGIVISNKATHEIFKNLLKQISNKNYHEADKLLIDCHIKSSNFKAITSWIGIDVARRLLTDLPLDIFKVTKIPWCFSVLIPTATYEGDNIVLLQQTAKYLIFKFKPKDEPKPQALLAEDDWQGGVKALNYIIKDRITRLKSRIQVLAGQGIGYSTIWNQIEQKSLIDVSILWGKMTLLKGLGVILPTIADNRPFFQKISRCFTEYILRNINDLAQYGITLEERNSWKTFSEQQFDAMVNINLPVQRQMEEVKFLERGKWWQPRL